VATAIVALIWLGMLIGVSFLATPVKFVVQDLTLPIALQVGQATFGLFSRIEWGLAVLLVGASAWRWREGALCVILALSAAAVVLMQAVWLLPTLDARVALIVAGETPPPSAHHTFYATLEAAKALMLIALAFTALRGSARTRSQH